MRRGGRIGGKALVNQGKPRSVSRRYNVGIASVFGSVRGGVNRARGGGAYETGGGLGLNGCGARERQTAGWRSDRRSRALYGGGVRRSFERGAGGRQIASPGGRSGDRAAALRALIPRVSEAGCMWTWRKE